jgi:hypothetical protein
LVDCPRYSTQNRPLGELALAAALRDTEHSRPWASELARLRSCDGA